MISLNTLPKLLLKVLVAWPKPGNPLPKPLLKLFPKVENVLPRRLGILLVGRLNVWVEGSPRNDDSGVVTPWKPLVNAVVAAALKPVLLVGRASMALKRLRALVPVP